MSDTTTLSPAPALSKLDPALEIPDIGFENANIAAAGRSAVFNFPDGIHSWRY